MEIRPTSGVACTTEVARSSGSGLGDANEPDMEIRPTSGVACTTEVGRNSGSGLGDANGPEMENPAHLSCRQGKKHGHLSLVACHLPQNRGHYMPLHNKE